jgi:hypothetical protein
MVDPYVPPTDPEERLIEIALDPWVGYARMALWFCGVVYFLFGLTLGPLMAMPFLMDPTLPENMGVILAVVFTVVTLVICGGFGLLNFVAAAGLGRGARWGWILALVVGAIYLPSACVPFGAVIMYGMLNDRTRKLFNG